ncbi:MAG: integrase domain-containing protein, partial [Candidatus Thorarchaeota archaeon]
SHIHCLKQKHVKCLNQVWKDRDLSIATIKNRNAMLRWTCKKINKKNVVPSNEDLGIGKRTYLTNVNKAVDIKSISREIITNKNVWVQIHLQRYLGLRREEAIKFKPHKADHKNFIRLDPSWCKGGRGRDVPILTREARYWIDEAKKLAKNPNDSLVPKGKNYIMARHIYDKQLYRAGVKHPHGLRHAYAQEKYRELTGWNCPACGGPTYKELTEKQKKIDYDARLKISLLLGHSRVQIVSNYCGK